MLLQSVGVLQAHSHELEGSSLNMEIPKYGNTSLFAKFIWVFFVCVGVLVWFFFFS